MIRIGQVHLPLQERLVWVTRRTPASLCLICACSRKTFLSRHTITNSQATDHRRRRDTADTISTVPDCPDRGDRIQPGVVAFLFPVLIPAWIWGRFGLEKKKSRKAIWRAFLLFGTGSQNVLEQSENGVLAKKKRDLGRALGLHIDTRLHCHLFFCFLCFFLVVASHLTLTHTPTPVLLWLTSVVQHSTLV